MRASGQQVDLRAQGVDMMRKMGIEAAVRAAAVHESGMQLVDLEGRVKAFFPANRSGKGRQSFTSEYEIMRGDLVRILYGLTEGRENVRHLFGTTVKSWTQDPEDDPNGKVHVTFHDDHTESFDLVVAADGTGSKTRAAMLGPDAPDPRHWMGGSIAYFSIVTGARRPGPLDHLPAPRPARRARPRHRHAQGPAGPYARLHARARERPGRGRRAEVRDLGRAEEERVRGPVRGRRVAVRPVRGGPEARAGGG